MSAITQTLKRMSRSFRRLASLLVADRFEHPAGAGRFLERPARLVGRRALGQHGLELPARLRVAAQVDVELRQLDPYPGQPRVETLGGLEVLLRLLAVAAQDHRQLPRDAAGHDM